MARKSRKVDFVNAGNEAIVTATKPDPGKKVSHAALYARLSFESDANRERNTIETQMALLHSYVESKDDIVVRKEYFDISKTGTNFEREGFEEMMQDISAGTVDCVIVKDLSRLGRNYVEAGSYIERVFPFFGVRFISVNEQFDSDRDDVSMLINMSNVYNEIYSRDLSKKVKSAYRTYWKKGEYPAGFVAYGYEKDKSNPHKLVPDPETAPIVKRIFQMFMDGSTYAEIARVLDEENILCPGVYSRIKHGKEMGDLSEKRWHPSTVNRILQNEKYMGDCFFNKRTNEQWGKNKKIDSPRSEWILVENTHEPLISREVFEQVQKKKAQIKQAVISARKNDGATAKDFNFFRGKCFCAECQKPMYLTGGSKGHKRLFRCSSYTRLRKCTPNSVYDTEINEYVLRVIRTHINVYMESVTMIRKLNQRQASMKKYDIFTREIKKCRKKLEELAKNRERLFEDYAYRIIDAEQYEKFLEQDMAHAKELQEKLDLLITQKVGYEREYRTDEEWEQVINKYRRTRTLTREMVDAFVEKLEISSDRSITVHLKYDDMLYELKNYTKIREAEECR
jgi:DNA invertase Pin-like site-specific DNA recombinase